MVATGIERVSSPGLGMIFRCSRIRRTIAGTDMAVKRDFGSLGLAGLSFEAFLKDVGHAPSAYHSLGRLDHDRNYEPGNVAWQTTKEQVECWKESRGRGRK